MHHFRWMKKLRGRISSVFHSSRHGFPRPTQHSGPIATGTHLSDPENSGSARELVDRDGPVVTEPSIMVGTVITGDPAIRSRESEEMIAHGYPPVSSLQKVLGLITKLIEATGTTHPSEIHLRNEPVLRDLATQILTTMRGWSLPESVFAVTDEILLSQDINGILVIIQHLMVFYSSGIQYQRLPDKCIRLLTLLPGQGSDCISCQLDVYSLDELPEYEALSYTWGPPMPKYPIICNEKTAEVTGNLNDALKSLRYPNETRMIWADQLCIWQADTVEKAVQVQRMDAIYRDASQVIMWVGVSVNDATTIEACLVADLCSRISRITVAPSDIAYKRDQAELLELGLPPPGDARWAALQTFLELPYFKRSWIVQEVFMACKHLLLWSTVPIPWNEVLDSVEVLHHRYDIATHVLPGAATHLPHFRSLARQQKAPLYELLKENRSRAATDIRDRVFSLIPMADPAPSLVKVDYECSPQTIFQMAARQTISDTNRIDFLAHHLCGGIEPVILRDSWPSWTPSWTLEDFDAGYAFVPKADAGEKACIEKLEEDISNLQVRGIVMAAVRYTTQDYFPRSYQGEVWRESDLLRLGLFWYDLATDGHASLAAEHHRDVLELLGQLVDFYFCCSNLMISSLGPMRPHIDKLLLAVHAISREVRRIFLSVERIDDEVELGKLALLMDIAFAALVAHSRDGTQEPVLEITVLLAKLQTLAWSGDNEEYDRRTSSKMEAICQRLNIRPSNPGRIDDLVKRAVTIEMDIAWRGDDPMRLDFHEVAAISNLAHHCRISRRSPGLTSEGQLCVGPSSMQVGDIVAVLFGCDKPLVLRRCSESDAKYTIVGDCYVPGIMEGEFIECLRAEGTLEDRVEEFCLV